MLQFSEAPNPVDAQIVSAYSLVTVPNKKKQRSQRVAISTATYNAQAFTVTLLTRKTLSLNPPLQLTISAAAVLDGARSPPRRQLFGTARGELRGDDQQERGQCQQFRNAPVGTVHGPFPGALFLSPPPVEGRADPGATGCRRGRSGRLARRCRRRPRRRRSPGRRRRPARRRRAS